MQCSLVIVQRSTVHTHWPVPLAVLARAEGYSLFLPGRAYILDTYIGALLMLFVLLVYSRKKNSMARLQVNDAGGSTAKVRTILHADDSSSQGRIFTISMID